MIVECWRSCHTIPGVPLVSMGRLEPLGIDGTREQAGIAGEWPRERQGS
ncbi:MAG: hypothetical protein WCK86_16160 [Planctomycetia bacterium]